MSVHQRIREFITTAFPSIKEGAAAIGMTPDNLQKYMRDGGHKPGWDVVSRLWDAGCNIPWLIDGKGSMFAENQAGRDLEARIVNRSRSMVMPHFRIGQPVPDEFPKHLLSGPPVVREPADKSVGYTTDPTASQEERTRELELENAALKGEIRALERIITTLTSERHGTSTPSAPSSGAD